MNRIAATLLGLSALLAAAPASAVTVENGVVHFTQADALAGDVTPGDAPGFPVTLSVSGSYRFASNLLVNAAVNGIEVTAPEVTIDFAGFRMAGSGVGRSAILAFQRALTVKNGTIRGFTDYVIYSNDYQVIDHMRIVDNPIAANFAAVRAGDFGTVRNSNISRNSGYAIVCAAYCVISRNILTGNPSTYAVMNIQGKGGVLVGNTVIGAGQNAIFSINPVSIGDNTIVGNGAASDAPLLPLDPNQPPPPVP